MTGFAPGPEAGQRPATILVVDGDALVAMNIVDMLAELGHLGIEAFSGREALAIIARGTRVDAIITDYAMPGMGGLELARKARQLLPGLPVMLATGYADLPEDAAGAFPRLDKPFDERLLAEGLAAVLRERPER